MPNLKPPGLPLLLCLGLSLSCALQGASFLNQTACEQASEADAVGLGNLVRSITLRVDGRIMTRFTFSRAETLCGTLPAYFDVYAPGGAYRGEAKADSRLPKLQADETYLLFLRVVEGQLQFQNFVAGVVDPESVDLPALRACAAGMEGADLSAFAREPIAGDFSVTSSGLSDSNGNGPRRFSQPDRGEPIPVLVDVSTLPNQITESQALTALQNALDAWEAESSILFELVGTEVFSKSADDFTSSEGRVIRVQMHDNFNKIPDGSTLLGFGGSGLFIAPGEGATVDGRAFNPNTYGYVLMEASAAALSDPVNLEEVLAHELGHVIGLAHSSETAGESDPLLADALMYFRAHKDGRGASLRTYDIDTVAQSHPANTPPFANDRVLRAITIPSGTLANPEVNEVVILGGDLQGDPLSFSVFEQGINGTIALTGNRARYTPNGYFSETVGSFDSALDTPKVVVSDGVHLSAPASIRVLAFLQDTHPSNNPDGIPDTWTTDFFLSDSGSLAGLDPDGDGLSNLSEFLLGLDPTDPASRFEITQFADGSLEWTSRQYSSYTVERSTDLENWSVEAIVTPDAPGDRSNYDALPAFGSESKAFFRVVRVP